MGLHEQVCFLIFYPFHYISSCKTFVIFCFLPVLAFMCCDTVAIHYLLQIVFCLMLKPLDWEEEDGLGENTQGHWRGKWHWKVIYLILGPFPWSFYFPLIKTILLVSSNIIHNEILLYLRDPDQVAMDKLTELAYKKLLVSQFLFVTWILHDVFKVLFNAISKLHCHFTFFMLISEFFKFNCGTSFWIIDRELKEALLLNMGFLRCQNKLLWPSASEHLLDATNTKLQELVALRSLCTGRFFMHLLLSLPKRSCFLPLTRKLPKVSTYIYKCV